MAYQDGLPFAEQLDQHDPLARFRNQFAIPPHTDGTDKIYFVGNSLGLQPEKTQLYIDEELEKWRQFGVHGHAESQFPWTPYHEFLTEPMSRIVGGLSKEVVMMNALTVNLHFMMVSFYRPTAERYKILIEDHAFPSDHFAVESQIKHHGYDPKEALVLAKPRAGEDLLRLEDIAELIEREGSAIALVLLPGVQYYTGQLFNVAEITRLGHAQGCLVGWDLAHSAGNVPLSLHDWNVDFACWCTYKYLNSGPGAVAGCFVHERHVDNPNLVHFAGWWSHKKATRFEMSTQLDPIPTAERWQVSNSPIFSMAAVRASLEIFEEVGGLPVLREKAEKQTQYLDFLLNQHLQEFIESITPIDLQERGCQFSLRVKKNGKIDGKELFHHLEAAGVACDWRYPNVIRIAPVPLYNSYCDIYRFVTLLKDIKMRL